VIEEVLKSIGGIGVYPIMGLFVFLAGFVAVLVATWRMKKSDVDYASRLPLDDGIVSAAVESQTGDELTGEDNSR
jgi:cbb3-type cytochrome oxidase subunit 3